MHPPRLPHSNYVGLRRYFLTFCVFARRPVFEDAAVVKQVWGQIQQASSRQDIEICAYCFMPDHVHLLCQGLTDEADVERFVADAKQRAGYAFARDGRGRLWQTGFYDTLLLDDEEMIPVIRYIIGNPVRKGLTTALGDYPHAGVVGFTIAQIVECIQSWQPRKRSRGRLRRD